MPRPPALETAAAKGAPDARAMPARRMGCLIPRSLERGVCRDMMAVIVLRRESQKQRLRRDRTRAAYRLLSSSIGTLNRIDPCD